LGKEELLALCWVENGVVSRFEVEFARAFEARQAIAFPYGRSALWALLKSLDIKGAEIIMPAYTCVVVAHAILLSGNIPRFVDITLSDYNMDLEQVAEVINENTRVIVATHIFGYPLDVDRLKNIVRDAENRFGNKILIIQDCAHAFGARMRGNLVCNSGDAALFGLNISKVITSIFGGMITTNDSALAERLRIWRDSHFTKAGAIKALFRRLYLIATHMAFQESIYNLVNWLQESTLLLDRFTKAYHLDGVVHFPPDFTDRMLDVEAQVGIVQLRKYPEIVKRRHEHALFYDQQLQGIASWELPPIVDGATYSHYVIRLPGREQILQKMAGHGIQLGQLIDYCVPHMEAYKNYQFGKKYTNSLVCSQHAINLPVFADLSQEQRWNIVRGIQSINEKGV